MTSTPTTVSTRSTRTAQRRRRAVVGACVVVAWSGWVMGCRSPEYSIPPADGELTIAVRNIGETPLNVSDQVGLWGTIGTGRGSLKVNGRNVPIEPNGTFSTVVPLPDEEPARLILVATHGSDSISREVQVRRTSAAVDRSTQEAPSLPKAASGWTRLLRPLSDTADAATQARPIYSRWTPGGTLAVPLPQGTTWPIDAATDSAVRLRLSSDIAVWVPRHEAPPVTAPADSLLQGGDVRFTADSSHAVVVIPMPAPTASTVEVHRDTVIWTLYRSRLPAGITPVVDPLVTSLHASNPVRGTAVVRAVVAGPLLGWRMSFRDGAMVLELRRDLIAGLRGLRVAVDAGHPPGGAMGPAGTREDILMLRVAREVARLLESRGAVPMLTREDSLPLSLDGRLVRAEAAGAQLFVSLHADAPGEGRHASSADFTRVHWWQPLSRGLARAVLDSLAPVLGTVPNGFPRTNLAVLRATWFPAVLIEPTTIALPAREAFLVSDEGVRRYAEGVVAGIQAWAAR